MAEPIIPLWKKQDPDTGEWIFGLSPADAARVEAGYACPFCLEPFEFYVSACPVCGRPQEKVDGVILPTPVEWR